MDPRFRFAPFKKCAFKRISKCIASIGQRLGFNHYECLALCDQIQKYRKEEDPFDLDNSFVRDNPINWWKDIDTAPEPNVLSKVACHLFSICPNSATCERGFSTLGWLFHKRRLNLSLDKLESMCKMILYWKSNYKTELGFYGIDQRSNTRLSEEDINIRIAEAFAEMGDDEFDEPTPAPRVTISGEPIPEDNCHVIIDVWIDKFVDLSHELIVDGIGDIPEDILDNSDEDSSNNNEDDGNKVGDEPDDSGKGDFNYNIDDLIMEDEDEDD